MYISLYIFSYESRNVLFKIYTENEYQGTLSHATAICQYVNMQYLGNRKVSEIDTW